MTGRIVYCYSDQRISIFRQGIIDNQRKTDPNFSNGTYSVCQLKLRKVIEPEDVLFFRTAWKDKPYIIGYFIIGNKKLGEYGPVLIAKERICINYNLPITEEIIRFLRPDLNGKINKTLKLRLSGGIERNATSLENANFCLGCRSFLNLPEKQTEGLIKIIDNIANKS
jgi:hypothetical protein